LCLLPTLLAVPVFYSLFDDVKNLPVFNRFRRGERARGKAARTEAVIPAPVHFGTEGKA
jgi:hypothetical protein